MVKKTISKLKKELDKFFSLFIRLRYATENTAEELEFVARFIAKITRSDYEDKISYYKLAVKNLKKEKGIE